MLTLKTTLLPHQRPALDKLYGLRVGALYMEMGTGKTRTALEFIARRLDAGKINRALWLCPCSVQQNLLDDLRKHAEGFEDVICVCGIESLSGSFRLGTELAGYVRAGSTMLIVDESNLVKNHEAIRTQRVTQLAALCSYRMILNGTPIGRNEADLYAQWYLLDWRILGYKSYWSFAANHLEYDPNIPGRVVRTLNVDYLVRKIEPYAYQVLRAECFGLPAKQYRTAYTRLSEDQGLHYSAIIDSMLASVDEMRPETLYRFFSACQAVISGLYVTDNGRHFETSPMFASPRDNPRIRDLMRVVGQTEGKVIIFAKYTHEIDSLLSVLREGYGEASAVPFYGDIPQSQRQRNIARFRGDARFLVANKSCAGYGLNLQFCHQVIYYSNDWDYATRIQSEDRVYRFGQEHEVTIIDLCAENTLDERILDCLNRKGRLVDEIKDELGKAEEKRGVLMKWVRPGKEFVNGKGIPQQNRL